MDAGGKGENKKDKESRMPTNSGERHNK